MRRPWAYSWETKRRSSCAQCGKPNARLALLVTWVGRMWLPVCAECVLAESMRTPVPEKQTKGLCL